MPNELSPHLKDIRGHIDTALSNQLHSRGAESEPLLEVMRYALLGGGKRIRPLLVCCTATSLGGSLEAALLPACAIECIHAYSLIHDDLPAMDDDDLRHGKPSCHRAFGEAQAILAGDALQSLAFEILSQPGSQSAERQLAMTRVLSAASGSQGMVGGQWLDIVNTGSAIDAATLEHMHRRKTGALIAAATEIGALASECTATTTTQLKHFGEQLGLIFQLVDDLLDISESSHTLGKPAGSDIESGKNTYPALFGVRGTQNQISGLVRDCEETLESLGIERGELGELLQLVVERSY